MRHRIRNIAIAGTLMLATGGLATPAKASLTPGASHQLARTFSGLSGRDLELVLSAVSKAAPAQQRRIVYFASRLTPQRRNSMVAVLTATLRPLSYIQARAVVDGLVGVAGPAEHRLSAALAATELAATVNALPPRLGYETYAVFQSYPAETQLTTLAADRLITAGLPAWQRNILVDTLEGLLEAIPPQYEAYSRSLVAELVGLGTPADIQRVRVLVAYLRGQANNNALWSAVNADLHNATIYQGRRSACVLGGGLLSGSGNAIIDGQYRTASLCNNDLIVR